jgi:hypothetical protein
MLRPVDDRANGAVVELVPPLATGTADPFHVPEVMVPTEVSEEVTTFEARVVPESVPAGATIAVLQLNPVPLVHINALAVVEQDGTDNPLGVVAVKDPSN